MTGDNAISLNQFAGSDCTRISAWVWATKPGGAAADPNALPPPELISLDGTALLATTEMASLPSERTRMSRPVDRINGIFLDAVEPVSVSQGYGTLQKNRSVGEKPLMIGSQRYLRGLGTHAPSKIVFSLDGKYRRFQAWAGADANAGPSGHLRGMGGRRQAVAVGVDDAGNARRLGRRGGGRRKTLELVVGDAGDRTSDHADWAEARLLR